MKPIEHRYRAKRKRKPYEPQEAPGRGKTPPDNTGGATNQPMVTGAESGPKGHGVGTDATNPRPLPPRIVPDDPAEAAALGGNPPGPAAAESGPKAFDVAQAGTFDVAQAGTFDAAQARGHGVTTNISRGGINEEMTHWGPVAGWYDALVGDQGSEYHQEVVLPGVLRLLSPGPADVILDLACGQGVLSRLLYKKGSRVVGVDAAMALVRAAQERSDEAIEYHVMDARDLSRLPAERFTAAACVLAIQNIDPLAPVFAGVARALRPGGRFVAVMMHPCFRVPKQTHWGWSDKDRTQYRRVDRYLRPFKEPIVVHPGLAARVQRPGDPGLKPSTSLRPGPSTSLRPGPSTSLRPGPSTSLRPGAPASARPTNPAPVAKVASERVWAFHRPLQTYITALGQAGLLVDRVEEWASHKRSDPGPKAEAEDRARQEIPLFLAWRCVKVG